MMLDRMLSYGIFVDNGSVRYSSVGVPEAYRSIIGGRD